MMYLDDLLLAGAELMQRGTSQEWRGFAYDSRLARTGDLFVALQTERADVGQRVGAHGWARVHGLYDD